MWLAAHVSEQPFASLKNEIAALRLERQLWKNLLLQCEMKSIT